MRFPAQVFAIAKPTGWKAPCHGRPRDALHRAGLHDHAGGSGKTREGNRLAADRIALLWAESVKAEAAERTGAKP